MSDNRAFWRKVEQCKHERADSGTTHIFCGTPHCHGAFELYCPDCHAYIVECPCGWCNTTSGWSESRWRNFRRKKRELAKGEVA